MVALEGASRQADSFFLVLAAVQFVTNSVAPIFETVLVPFVASQPHAADAASFVRSVMRRTLRVAGPLCLVASLTALLAQAWTVPAPFGWDNAWRHLSVLALLPLLSALASILAGYLNATEWFLWSSTAGSVRGLVSLALGWLLRPQLGVFGFAVGITAGELAALAWLCASRPGLGVLRADPASAPELARFWTLYSAAATSGAANSSKGFVDRFVASGLGPGAVSLIEATERLFLMAVSFAGAPLATILLSRWSGDASRTVNRAAVLRERLAGARGLAAALGLATLAIYPVVVLTPVWTRLFGHVSGAEVGTVKLALLLYCAGGLPYMLGLAANQAVLVLQDARFVIGVGTTIAVLNVVLDVLFVRLIGLPGIALASTLLHTCGWLAAEWRVRRPDHMAARQPERGKT